MNNLSKLDREPPKGRVYRYKNLLFWAQGGCICIEDTAMDGDFRCYTRPRFFAHILVFRQYGTTKTYKYSDERIADENFIINGCAALKEAKRQGDPFDPEVMKAKMFEWRRGRIILGDGTSHYFDTPRNGYCPSSKEGISAPMLPPLPIKDAPNPESMRREAADVPS